MHAIISQMAFDRAAFGDFVLRQNIISFKEEPVKFKSGRMGNCYVNWRVAEADAWALEKISDFVIAFAEDLGLKPDCFYGVPEGATKLGVITQYRFAAGRADYGPGAYPIPMGRAKPKDHGDPKDRYFVGGPRGATIVLEDTVTTGGSLFETVVKLKEAGVNVIAAIVLTDRGEKRDDGTTPAEALRKETVPYYALSALPKLLPRAYETLKPSEKIRSVVEAYFKQYGA